MSQQRKVYDFKSVGQLDTSLNDQENNTRAVSPVGITTPMSFGEKSGTLFAMSYDVSKQIKDNLRNLIATNKGERLMLGDFGANLRPLSLELTAEDIDLEAGRRIAETVSKYMPWVDLENFETRVETSETGNVIRSIVRVTYSVPSLGVSNQAVEAIILAAG